MSLYRCYFLDAEHHILEPPALIEASHDGAATDHAQQAPALCGCRTLVRHASRCKPQARRRLTAGGTHARQFLTAVASATSAPSSSSCCSRRYRLALRRQRLWLRLRTAIRRRRATLHPICRPRIRLPNRWASGLALIRTECLYAARGWRAGHVTPPAPPLSWRSHTIQGANLMARATPTSRAAERTPPCGRPLGFVSG
jgi:hypothetical protein